MTAISTKEAARQFWKVLKEAEAGPVIIKRYRRPRAVIVSIAQFRLYERALAHLSEDAAILAFQKAIDMAVKGRLGLAHRARRDARELSGLPTPPLRKRARKPAFDAGAGAGLEHPAQDETSAPGGADKRR